MSLPNQIFRNSAEPSLGPCLGHRQCSVAIHSVNELHSFCMASLQVLSTFLRQGLSPCRSQTFICLCPSDTGITHMPPYLTALWQF